MLTNAFVATKISTYIYRVSLIKIFAANSK